MECIVGLLETPLGGRLGNEQGGGEQLTAGDSSWAAGDPAVAFQLLHGQAFPGVHR